MAKKNTPFVLYDESILSRLHIRPNKRILPRHHGGGMQPFEGLQYPELMHALLDGRYSTADSILKKLTAPLPPKDAMAACLCALDSTEKRMNALLDQCPPIPEFQFLGVGMTTSLLNVAIRFYNHTMLKLLLKRGADPNGGPTPETAVSPLEFAFCNNAYLCLEVLLKTPGLHLELTPNMLTHWADLKPDLTNPCPADLMCCQALKEKLTGEPIDFDDPMPFPPQMQLETALKHLNLPLAAHICKKRSLTETEKASAVRYLSADYRIAPLGKRSYDYVVKESHEVFDFLMSILDQHPELAQIPKLRLPIVTMALVPYKPNDTLQRYVHLLEDGPVFLKELSASCRDECPTYIWFTIPQFLLRWGNRIGRRLVPAMDVSANLDLAHMEDWEILLIHEWVVFVGDPPADKVSTVAEQFLLYAPDTLLPELLKPGALLAKESPAAILGFCKDFPTYRRNLILAYLHKEVDYDL